MAEITLHYGQTSAAVSTLGAQIISFRGADGREVIWQADPRVWDQHAPVLFPVCGAVRDGKIAIAGREYPMSKHGFTRSNPEFQVSHLGDDFVDLTLTPNAESRAMYPFDFAFHVTYRLFEGGYTTTFLVENRSDAVMPVCVGGHPAFTCPMEAGAAFEDYQVVFAREESGEVAVVGKGGLLDGTERLAELQDGRVLPLTHQIFDEKDSLVFAGLNSRSVELVHRLSGRGLRLDFPKMESLVLWTMADNHGDYICLEPWHGLPGSVGGSGSFEDKPFVTRLKPGRVYTAWFTVTLI